MRGQVQTGFAIEVNLFGELQDHVGDYPLPTRFCVLAGSASSEIPLPTMGSVKISQLF